MKNSKVLSIKYVILRNKILKDASIELLNVKYYNSNLVKTSLKRR